MAGLNLTPDVELWLAVVSIHVGNRPVDFCAFDFVLRHLGVATHMCDGSVDLIVLDFVLGCAVVAVCM